MMLTNLLLLSNTLYIMLRRLCSLAYQYIQQVIYRPKHVKIFVRVELPRYYEKLLGSYPIRSVAGKSEDLGKISDTLIRPSLVLVRNRSMTESFMDDKSDFLFWLMSNSSSTLRNSFPRMRILLRNKVSKRVLQIEFFKNSKNAFWSI